MKKEYCSICRHELSNLEKGDDPMFKGFGPLENTNFVIWFNTYSEENNPNEEVELFEDVICYVCKINLLKKAINNLETILHLESN